MKKLPERFRRYEDGCALTVPDGWELAGAINGLIDCVAELQMVHANALFLDHEHVAERLAKLEDAMLEIQDQDRYLGMKFITDASLKPNQVKIRDGLGHWHTFTLENLEPKQPEGYWACIEPHAKCEDGLVCEMSCNNWKPNNPKLGDRWHCSCGYHRRRCPGEFVYVRKEEP
jgi:hypothetical protein